MGIRPGLTNDHERERTYGQDTGVESADDHDEVVPGNRVASSLVGSGVVRRVDDSYDRGAVG